MKSCGSCQRCCDGTYTDNINGHMMGNGVPCFFLGEAGCTIYDKRPDQPCRSYQCLWLQFENVPDYMKPENSGAIIDLRQLKDGTQYIMIEGKEAEYSAQVFLYSMEFAQQRKISLVYRRHGGLAFMGDFNDCRKIEKELAERAAEFNKDSKVV